MTKKRIYLDHNASTPIKPEVRDAMQKALDIHGNPSAIHQAGREARQLINDARQQIKDLINANTDTARLIFTSGATEANNLVLQRANVERIIISDIEHSSVQNVVPHAERIPVHPNGIIDLDYLDKMLEDNDRPTLISVMLVNNETGVIQPIEKVVDIAKRRGALVHSDAAQAVGRIPVDIQALGVDYMTLTAHKFGGPKGIGALIISNCSSVDPLIRGGSQEKNIRAGTENLPGIAGFGKAAELAASDMEQYQALEKLRNRLEEEILSIAPDATLFGREAPRVAGTLMFSTPDLTGETQVISLDTAGICVNTGSACYSGTTHSSKVAMAMTACDLKASTALRVSMGWDSTEEDIVGFIEEWKKLYDRVQKRKNS